MVGTASQVAVLGAVLTLAWTGAGTGCESPARVKPWRHAPDPTIEAASAPGSPALAEASGEQDVHAARAHTLRVHVDAEPGRLTPLVSPTMWARRITLGTIFEPLLRYVPPDGQGPGSYAPRLAQSWRVMPSGLEIRIELTPNVTFHDGHPLTTSDVQFTLDAIRDPHKAIDHLRPMLEDVEAIELITAHEIRLRLKRPSGWVLRALAEIPILPMHIYDGSLVAGGALVGTGPWKFGSNKAGVVHLTRYDRYWAGKPAIADLEFVYEPDAAVALREAKRGDLDLIPALIPAHWPEQANAPGIVAAFRPLELGTPRLRYLAFNPARAPLDDPRVRHALALLIDRRTIAKRVFAGLVRPALWPIWPGGPISGPEPAVPDFDPAAAAKLLDAAGWTDSEPKDGIRDQGGKQLRLTMLGGEKPAPKDASGPPQKLDRDYFIEAARRVGVVIDVKTGGEAWIEKKLADGNYDLAELSWSGMVDADPSSLIAHASPQIDRGLDALAAAWDPAERARLTPELAAGFAETWPLAGIVADAPHGLIAKRVKGARVWDGWIDFSQLTLE
ncbi:MAG TPA: ABC transporter substrate-binding protein [Kofleriaceae bacterium]|nr:ABC transporter substrate-binding protein [Kofleriaceae bacterium]